MLPVYNGRFLAAGLIIWNDLNGRENSDQADASDVKGNMPNMPP